MKLTFSDRCEQGTDSGAMLFRKGGVYQADVQENGVLISHEPRQERRRVDGKRVDVAVTQTLVAPAVLEKLLAFGPVTKE